jgi:hypothetical protein
MESSIAVFLLRRPACERLPTLRAYEFACVCFSALRACAVRHGVSVCIVCVDVCMCVCECVGVFVCMCV